MTEKGKGPQRKEKSVRREKAGPEFDRYEELRDHGRINARIMDAATGLKVLTGTYVIRVKNTDGLRLFMNDYLPTLGKVYGSVTFLTRDGEVSYNGIQGFYKLQHNEFTLLIEGDIEEEELAT